MSFIIFAILVILVIAMIIWGIGYLDMIPPPIRNVLMALVIVLGALLIAQKAGLF
jgi:hypothetical protein